MNSLALVSLIVLVAVILYKLIFNSLFPALSYY